MAENKENREVHCQCPLLPPLPDRNLRAWDMWSKIRREDTTKLSIMLDKEPVDLAMNLLYKVRGDKERKQALEYAQIKRKTEVEGADWDKLLSLKQFCSCAPVYEIQKTRAEKGKPPVMKHICVPKYIRRTELGAGGHSERVSCTLLNTDFYDYREEREVEYQEELQKIFPYRLDDNLLIKGKRPVATIRKKFDIPEISIDIAPPVLQVPDAVYALKINDTVFYKEIPGQNLMHLKSFQEDIASSECTSWTLYINVPMNKIGHNQLILQNLGTVVLNYSWKKLKSRVPPIINIPPAYYEEVFFFNKNEDIVCPGQVKEIDFTFLTDTPGMYAETWELCVHKINFIQPPKQFLIHLIADSVENMSREARKVNTFKTRLNRRVSQDYALEIVNEIFANVFVTPTQIYPYKHYFLESEIFIMMNPVYFYHQTEVEKMKIQYTEMTGDVWDLSIPTFEYALMRKKFDERMMYYKLLQSYHRTFLKPWHEGDELAEEKHRAVKYLLGEFFDQFDAEYTKISERLVQPEALRAERMINYPSVTTPQSKPQLGSMCIMDPFTTHMTRMIFFIRVYEHFKNTIESCAGVLSSTDLNKWINFNFCRTH